MTDRQFNYLLLGIIILIVLAGSWGYTTIRSDYRDQIKTWEDSSKYYQSMVDSLAVRNSRQLLIIDSLSSVKETIRINVKQKKDSIISLPGDSVDVIIRSEISD